MSAETLKATFKATKTLYVLPSRSSRASLSCEYRLYTNLNSCYLAVEASSISLNFQATKRPVPIVRFEYERNARNKPVSHFQFHAESLPLGLLLARGGNYEKAAHQQDIHFPMGGHRFRVYLEDIVELVIREFNIEAVVGWELRVKEG